MNPSASMLACIQAPHPIQIHSAYGLTLRAARSKCGLSRDQAARGIGVPLSRLYDWEEGYSRPSAAEELRLYRLYKQAVHAAD